MEKSDLSIPVRIGYVLGGGALAYAFSYLMGAGMMIGLGLVVKGIFGHDESSFKTTEST